MGVGGQHHAPATLPPRPTVKEVRWAPVPVWTRAENLATVGISSPDREARSNAIWSCRNMYRRFEGAYCLWFQDGRVPWEISNFLR